MVPAEDIALSAGFTHAEDAAAFVAVLGPSAQIRVANTGAVVWREGAEKIAASESYDAVAETVNLRERTLRTVSR